DFSTGDIVLGYGGWQEYSVETTGHLRRIDPELAPISTHLGVLGMPGFTAYAGLLEIGQPQEGETVAVPPPPVPSAPSSVRSRRSRERPPSASPAARTRSPTCVNSASTSPWTTGRATCGRS